jgi:hypothetical protein
MHKIRRDLIMLGKGGDKMKQARKIMVSAMEKLSEGKMPQKVADIIHKNGHSIAQNEFAETKAVEVMGQGEQVESLNRSLENLKETT